jgi:dTDP-4-dehydrorhamnose reductase
LTILKLAALKPELKIVADQHGAPTWSHDLAKLTAHIVTGHTTATLPSGVYHASAQGETTWHGFASAAVAQSHLPNPALITPIQSSEYPTPAARPKNSRLNTEKLVKTFNVRLPYWQESLTAVLTELQG